MHLLEDRDWREKSIDLEFGGKEYSFQNGQYITRDGEVLVNNNLDTIVHAFYRRDGALVCNIAGSKVPVIMHPKDGEYSALGSVGVLEMTKDLALISKNAISNCVRIIKELSETIITGHPPMLPLEKANYRSPLMPQNNSK